MVNGASVQILQRKKESISIANIGHYSGVLITVNDLDIRAVEDSTTGYAVAQALLDQLATHESGLVVRQIIPNWDLCTPAGVLLTSAQWRQPYTGNYAQTDAATREDIYTTGTASKNDRKIIAFYGYQLVVAPYRSTPVLKSVEVVWNKGSVKVIDVNQIQGLEAAKNAIGVLRTPILAKKNDDLKIQMVANTDAATSSKFDQIIFLGVAVEAIGQNMMG